MDDHSQTREYAVCCVVIVFCYGVPEPEPLSEPACHEHESHTHCRELPKARGGNHEASDRWASKQADTFGKAGDRIRSYQLGWAMRQHRQRRIVHGSRERDHQTRQRCCDGYYGRWSLREHGDAKECQADSL